MSSLDTKRMSSPSSLQLEKTHMQQGRPTIASPQKNIFFKKTIGASLVVQLLRCHIPNAGGLVSIAGTKLRVHMLQLRLPHAAMKNEDPKHSQINK